MRDKQCVLCGCSAEIKIDGEFFCSDCLSDILKTKHKLENDMDLIWKELNNAYYFGATNRGFFNLIHDVATIIQPSYESIGKERIE